MRRGDEALLLLRTISDVADAFGVTQPAELLMATPMNRSALVHTIGKLARGKFVAIDQRSGTIALTPSGRAQLAAQGVTADAGSHAQPAGYALREEAAVTRAKRAALPEAAEAAAVQQSKDVAVAIRRGRHGMPTTQRSRVMSRSPAQRPTPTAPLKAGHGDKLEHTIARMLERPKAKTVPTPKKKPTGKRASMRD